MLLRRLCIEIRLVQHIFTFNQRLNIIDRFTLLRLLRQLRRRLAHIELPRHHVRHQPRPVFADQRDFALRALMAESRLRIDRFIKSCNDLALLDSQEE